jgi:3'(2'), 5'-bisphosphate nucleotidase
LGFLRKEQYAVCLALIVDGKVEVGVLAAPNLGVDHIHDKEEGVLFLAVKGEGSWSVSNYEERLTLPRKEL